MPTQEMRAIWHPARAQLLELLTAGPTARSRLVEATGGPLAKVAYHCTVLCRAGSIQYADSSGPESADPRFEVT